jgi:hypothetical protein
MEWTQFVTKYYNERRATDKNYAFKSAMTDAKESYYSQSPGANVAVTKKRRTGKRRKNSKRRGKTSKRR